MKKSILIILISFIVSSVYSQEIITTLNVNPVLLNKKHTHHIKTNKSLQSSLKLPFVDDFSNYTGYPDSNLWLDDYVFVNKQFALYPPTLGVATFDALDPNGVMYFWATTFQYPADTLTSQPIRLDSIFQPTYKVLRPSDSLYFSFYFQPGGGRGNMWSRLGNPPEPEDSLVLEFYSPSQQQWNEVWSTQGMPLDSIYLKDSLYFKYVLIPITDSALYYANGFQFRFMNFCSLGTLSNPSWASNCDEWNIDYVYLGVNRTMHDTVLNDLTFIEAAPSFLNNYQAMPAEQFQSSDLKTTLNMTLSNIDDTIHPSFYKYEIRDAAGTLVHTEDRGEENIPSFWLSGYQQSLVHSTPPVTYAFGTVNANNQTNFEIRHIFKESQDPLFKDFRTQNDTNYFIQRFENYYAYDDGTAENGYGLTPAGSMLASRFVLHNPDTLVAVQMFFNSTVDSANLQPFYLTVWNNNGNIPGDTLYSCSQIYPAFENGLNQYHTYFLQRPVKVSGTIYVGFVQTTDDNLNLGFDRNTDSHANIFYNSSGTWMNSFMTGSLMIRPVFGMQTLAVNDIAKSDFAYRFYPNPLNTEALNIELKPELNKSVSNYTIYIYNMFGNLVYQTEYKNTINLSSLSNGVYTICLTDKKSNQQKTSKLIITR